jgi:hypothetical protein
MVVVVVVVVHGGGGEVIDLQAKRSCPSAAWVRSTQGWWVWWQR